MVMNTTARVDGDTNIKNLDVPLTKALICTQLQDSPARKARKRLRGTASFTKALIIHNMIMRV
eukprot:10072231-Karenia_brevis.AAC.1